MHSGAEMKWQPLYTRILGRDLLAFINYITHGTHGQSEYLWALLLYVCLIGSVLPFPSAILVCILFFFFSPLPKVLCMVMHWMGI